MRALGVDDDPARLDQQVGDPDRDQVGGADREQRQQRQDRRPVDEQQQEEDEAEGGDQQGAAGVVGDPLEVGGDPGRAGDVGAEPRRSVGCEVGADLARRRADDRAAVVGVDRQHRRSAASPSRESGPTPLAIRATSPSGSRGVGRRRGR